MLLYSKLCNVCIKFFIHGVWFNYNIYSLDIILKALIFLCPIKNFGKSLCVIFLLRFWLRKGFDIHMSAFKFQNRIGAFWRSIVSAWGRRCGGEKMKSKRRSVKIKAKSEEKLRKQRKNCECCPLSLFIEKSQWILFSSVRHIMFKSLLDCPLRLFSKCVLSCCQGHL